MIPISTFNLLLVVGILFVVYSVIDHRNRLYANIIIAFTAALLMAFLGAAISSDAVYEVVAGVVTAVNSPSEMFFLYFISVVMFMYTLFMTYEVIDEQFQKKKIALADRENTGEGIKTSRIFQAFVIIGIVALITLGAVFAQAMFQSVFIEGGSAYGGMTSYGYMQVYSWIYIIAAFLIIAVLIIAFKLFKDDSYNPL